MLHDKARSEAMILICYDGSEDAKSAIEHGGELLSGQRATVLTVWETFAQVIVHSPSGFAFAPGMVNDTEQIDAAAREYAEDRAQEGVELARTAGLEAQARTVSQETTTAEAILDEADAVGATAILMGSRGLTGLKSVLLGSVSHAVIQHADRAVIVVPSPDVASARHRARTRER
jgi:nucleotide-binding universal stress UspA family protein